MHQNNETVNELRVFNARKQGDIMSTLKLKKEVSQGGSLQMALLHLRWQQIRQLELEQLSFEVSNQENILPIRVPVNQENYSTV